MVMSISKEYMRLIKRFPLRPIRTKADHVAAMKLVEELMTKGEENCTVDEIDYLSVIAELIQNYESTLPGIRKMRAAAAAITPAEALSFLLEENGLTQVHLSEEIGCDRPNLSAFLAGRRGLSKSNAIKLAERFKVSVSLFLPTQRAAG